MIEKTAKWTSFVLALVLVVVTMGLDAAEAQAGQEALLVPVDGFLTDRENRPVDEQLEVTFSLYASASADDAFWSETHQIDFSGGAFSAYLGSYEQLSAQDFGAHRTPYMAMQIEGDSEMDRWPLGAVPFAAVANQADDATTLQGLGPDELGGASNAGDVTFDDSQADLGVETSQEAIEALLARLEQVEAQLAAQESGIAVNSDDISDLYGQISGYDADLDSLETTMASHDTAITNLENDVAINQGNINGLEGDISTLEGQMSMVTDEISSQGAQLTSLEQDLSQVQHTIEPMTRMSVHGQDSLVFDAVNVHIRSGQGSTTSTVNGRGNLIVGYDEGDSANKTGSHNIVFGTHATYSSFGGLVGGTNNTIDGQYASAISGTGNQATGDQSVILGASSATASGTGSVVVSGSSGDASGFRSVVTGGWHNTASGSWSVVSGGSNMEETRMDYWRGGGLSSISD